MFAIEITFSSFLNPITNGKDHNMNSFRNFARLAAAAMLSVAILSSPSWGADAPKPKILVLTHATGFWHSSLPLGEQTLTEMGKKSGAFETVCLEGYKQ